MKKIVYFMLAIIFATATASCNYLDKAPEADGYTFEDVFTDSLLYRNYCEYLVLIPLFQYQQAGERPIGSWDCITDNSMSTCTFPSTPSVQAAKGDYYTLRLNGNALMCNVDTWSEIWRHIRVANTGIRNIHLYPGSVVSRNKILGMCYFYRAFCYMELCRRWGGMPYLYEPFEDVSQTIDPVRLDMRETYRLAAIDFDSAAMYLKDVISKSEFQHPTRVAALAFKSRVLLYSASDQARYEKGSDAGDLWEQAALAADEAIKAAEDSGYRLASWNDYYYIFKGNNDDIYTAENLFARRATHGWNLDAYMKNCGRPPGQLGGTYGTAPNQTFIDCFEMKDTGLPIGEPDSGYEEQNPYVGRDPRFEHNILYNGSVCMGRTLQIYNYDENTSRYGSLDLTCDVGGNPTMGNTQTGTYVRKWLGDTYNQALPLQWPYIRMAELYLNFAEAANEAWEGRSTAQQGCRYSAVEALNVIRNRAQMPDVDSRFTGSRSALRDRIRNERRIELCFEEHRLFDLRRWKIGKEEMNRDIFGVYITKLAAPYDTNQYPTGYKYDRRKVQMRAYQDRHDLFVIRLDDTTLGPNFNQNPGW